MRGEVCKWAESEKEIYLLLNVYYVRVITIHVAGTLFYNN